MRAKCQRWGNSLAVRIPKAITEQVGVREQDELKLEGVARVIRMRPKRRRVALDRLLKDVTPENLHGELDFGKAKGRDAW